MPGCARRSACGAAHTCLCVVLYRGAKYPSMMSTTCAADMAAARQAAQLPELIGQHYLARAMAGALNPPGASSDRTTEIEVRAQLADAARQGGAGGTRITEHRAFFPLLQ